MDTIRQLRWDVLPHPPYSPDLAPSDYYLFARLKHDLAGRHFEDNNSVITAVREWIRTQPNTFFEEGIKQLPERWERCIGAQGDYFE